MASSRSKRKYEASRRIFGALRRDIIRKWDLGIDLRHAQNVARDHVLASDPQGARPDTFYKIDTALLYLSRRF